MTYSYEPKTKPFKHQSTALKRNRAPSGEILHAFAWLMEMGTGKTKVDIDEACELFETGKIDVWLIFAPKGVYMNWIDNELPAHVPDHIMKNAEIVEWRSGGGIHHKKKLRNLITSAKGFRILVMNIEAVSSGKNALDYAEEFLKSSRVSAKISVDESTGIKNPGTRRTSAVLYLKKHAHYRRIITGSPVTKSPLDIYSQFMFLDEKILGFNSYYSFRARYAVLRKMNFGGRTVNTVVGYRDIDGLTKKIAPFSYRVKKEDCLDLPPKIYMRRDVEMTDEQRRIYCKIRDEASAEIENGEYVTATVVITQILRMHQVLCGHVKSELGDEYDVPTNRIDALMDVIEESDGKIIIWANYRRDIEKIVAELKKRYGEESICEFHGGVDTDGRRSSVDRFQNGDARFMVSNQQTGGYGNTWTAATNVIYYSNNYDLEKRVQSEDRAHRSGQKYAVTYTDLVVPGTVDELMLKALREKIDIASTVLGDGYKKWLI